MHSQIETKLIITKDGSHSLYVPHLNEHYHSTHGAIQESRHVFINSGLHANKLQQVNILEIGFGTGLNAFLTLLESKKKEIQVNYTTLELYPLDIECVKQLNYAQLSSDEDAAKHFLTLHESPWGVSIQITPFFTLHKVKRDFSKVNSIIETDTRFDVIYYDAFAPEKQPEMWTQQIFDKLFSVCNKKGVLTTYCAKGVVRRMLESSGFTIEKLPGPPGKREILRCRKL